MATANQLDASTRNWFATIENPANGSSEGNQPSKVKRNYYQKKQSYPPEKFPEQIRFKWS